MIEWIIPAAVFAAASVITSLRVLREYERGVVFRLGRLVGAKGPGLIFLVPLGVERMVKVPLRIVLRTCSALCTRPRSTAKSSACRRMVRARSTQPDLPRANWWQSQYHVSAMCMLLSGAIKAGF